MTPTVVAPVERPLRGACRVPGDKAISHRAAILPALAVGRSVARGFSPAGDCASTLAVLAALGVEVDVDGDRVGMEGRGIDGLRPPAGPLDCGRSGTTMRLMAGVLAAAGFDSLLTGDAQLMRRPMARVAEPLRLMGAEVRLGEGDTPPVSVHPPAALGGIEYEMPVASAQVKSAVLLAGLHASGETTVIEAAPTRDHTERLLAAMGASISAEGDGEGTRITIAPGPLSPLELEIPGDISSAAYILAAAVIVPGSDVVVEHVGLNPGRMGFVRALQAMGAAIEVARVEDGAPEPHGDIRITEVPLQGIRVDADDVPSMIDELPILALVATQAEGVTEVRGAAELRVKESDRIAGLVAGLRRLGADVEELRDGFVVRGPAPLGGGTCDALTDHRLAMTFAVAGLVAGGPVEVSGMEFVGDSFPTFLEQLRGLG